MTFRHTILRCTAFGLMLLSTATARAQSWGDPFLGLYWTHACSESAALPICYAFIRGIQGANEMLLYGHKAPLWCETPGVSLDQLRQVFLKELSDNVADLNREPGAGIAIFGFMKAFPCKPPQ